MCHDICTHIWPLRSCHGRMGDALYYINGKLEACKMNAERQNQSSSVIFNFSV